MASLSPLLLSMWEWFAPLMVTVPPSLVASQPTEMLLLEYSSPVLPRITGNPASSFQLDKLYAIPMLLSGIGPLVLTNAEINSIEQHHKETLRNLLRLHQKTPRSVIYFLAGSLPGSVLVHLRQLSIFGMICRLQGNILNQHARNAYSSSTISNKSWFHQIRKWCFLNGRPIL